MPEDVYRGDLVTFPGPWSFQIGKSAIILVSDKELESLSDPDKVLNLSLTFDKQEGSLRQVCERAKAAGHRTLILAFDHFFSQYRPGQAGPRKLTPDMDEYVKRIASISRFALQYGLGLELSLLSPLEIGPAYQKQTGESGMWLHYRKGWRDPKSGSYSVQLWRQKQWANNKGVIDVADAGVRVFAFHETAIPGTPYRAVDPKGIVEISETAQTECLGSVEGAVPEDRIRVFGKGRADLGSLDRVLVVQQYRTPEMDYFSDKALPFLNKLVDKYADAGVRLNGLYADEMHIQQDWAYHRHHDHGQFAMRYVSPGLARRYCSLYGEEYRDLAKYMVYFTYGQEDFANDLTASEGVMDTLGGSPEDVRRTALFRARYFHLLQDGVVDLFTAAKRHAELRMGHRLESRAHATWAESPTIDFWRTGREPMFRSAYEYTPDFVWSNTIQQTASACSDYFKWGDFLTGNGNDHAEGGYADRDYFALALACSTGILNEVPYSYAAHWGMPDEISRRRGSLENVYGAAGHPAFGMVEGMQHRDVDVLMLYPLDLTAVEERFGSWMTQYGYANYVTAAKLLQRGKVASGAIEIAGRRFTTLVSAFEPFPSKRLLAMMRALAESGGRVIWSGPPPVISYEGDDALGEWQALFGVSYRPAMSEGVSAPGKQITFIGPLAGVPAQSIPTDFLVDHIYPVGAVAGTETAVHVKDLTVGTVRRLPGGGTATFLGLRPRDDQSKSLGYEVRTWFEVLRALGSYGPGNDNTEFISRNSEYLACRFPNGAVALSRHFRDVEEGWPGGFARNSKQDRDYISTHPMPTEEIHLQDFRINGHKVNYDGHQAVAFRVNGAGELTAFAGNQCRRIFVDGRETVFSDKDMPFIAWAPVSVERRVPGGAVMQILVHGAGTIKLPLADLRASHLFAEGGTPGSRGETIPCTIEGGALVFNATDRMSGRWIYATP